MRLRDLIIALTLLAAPAAAGEKKLMHCFAWTAVQEATPADWEAFYRASDALPSKIKAITKVWYGRLASPLNQTRLAKIDPEAFKKFQAGETVSADVRRANREYGICMEMADEAALKAYDSDPYHKIWTEAYAKVRVEGTTTFNIIGQ
jgi:hypothetical protein